MKRYIKAHWSTPGTTQCIGYLARDSTCLAPLPTLGRLLSSCSISSRSLAGLPATLITRAGPMAYWNLGLTKKQHLSVNNNHLELEKSFLAR
jgi:hypothetical protein